MAAGFSALQIKADVQYTGQKLKSEKSRFLGIEFCILYIPLT